MTNQTLNGEGMRVPMSDEISTFGDGDMDNQSVIDAEWQFLGMPIVELELALEDIPVIDIGPLEF